MKRFPREDLEVGLSWASLGNQALVLFFEHHGRESGAVGWQCGKLFDFDETRLMRTARSLGIERAALVRSQGAVYAGMAVEAPYVEVWGKPLQRALLKCRLEGDPGTGRAS